MNLTIAELLLLHFLTEHEIHGADADFSLRDTEMLDSIVKEYQDIGEGEYFQIQKAAVLTHRIINDRPFNSGSGRVGILAGLIHLLMNGYRLDMDPDSVYNACYETNRGEWSRDELEEWFSFFAHKKRK